MPCVEVREWRALIRHRGRLVEDQTRCKNRIRAHLRVRHLRKPHRSHWWSARNREWMWTQAREGTSPWHLKLTSLLQQLELLEGQVAEVTDRLDERAKGDARIELLKTIPGIGPRAAEALVAYTDDINRFSHCKKFASYFGVTPKLDESGDTRRLGHINKRGPTVVRWYLTEGCWRAIRRSPALAAFYHRVQHGRSDRKKVALIAVVRKVLTIIYAMLKTDTCFNEELVIAQLAEAA